MVGESMVGGAPLIAVVPTGKKTRVGKGLINRVGHKTIVHLQLP